MGAWAPTLWSSSTSTMTCVAIGLAASELGGPPATQLVSHRKV